MARRLFLLMPALGWCAAVLLLALVPARGPGQFDLGQGGKHITFTAAVAPMDPFSDLNRPDPPKDGKMAVGRGETFLLTITGTPEKGWHSYPLTLRAPEQLKAQLSSLTVEGGANFQPIFPVGESQPEWKDDRKDPKELQDVYLEHAKPFTWTQEVYVKPTAPAGQTVELPLKIRAQVCSNQGCIWEDHALTVPVTIAQGAPVEPSPELKKRLAVKATEPVVVPLPKELQAGNGGKAADDPKRAGGSSSAGPARPGTSGGGRNPDLGLIAAVLKAILGGLVSLATPCVFPMIPITVSFFLKQAEKRKPVPALVAVGGTGITASAPSSVATAEEPAGHSPVLLAAVYSGTIVLILSAAGLLLLGVLQQIISHYLTNFLLGGIFLFFALSLLGMYDITLPSWLQDRTAAGEGKGGLIGVFFMALTFSIVSFACVGPIFGGFITLAASGTAATGGFWKAVPQVLGFSVAFASPFFLLALFPSLLKSMGRAGGWMNVVKVVIGFLEMAAAVKFLRTGELVLTKASTLFTFDLSLGIYVALAVACGLYLLGLYRLPHDYEPVETITVPRLLFGVTFLTLALYMLPGLFKGPDGDSQRPRGKVYAWVESFLLPETDGPTAPGSAPAGASKQLVWHHRLDEALAEAKRDNKLVFIDFTGIACTNCRLNERDAFPRPEVQAALGQHVLLKLYAEAGVPAGIDQQPDSEGAIKLRNETFETNALPLYALVRPKGDSFELVRKILPSDSGLITDVPAFVKMLAKE
jgi:thiol:disulfide interchange protein DsbD